MNRIVSIDQNGRGTQCTQEGELVLIELLDVFTNDYSKWYMDPKYREFLPWLQLVFELEQIKLFIEKGGF